MLASMKLKIEMSNAMYVCIGVHCDGEGDAERMQNQIIPFAVQSNVVAEVSCFCSGNI